MAGLFNLAADRALHMSQPPPPKISIAIEIGQPPGGGGGLSSVQKRMNIGGQPHKLAYINSTEDSLLRHMGGLGEPLNGTRGVPAYIGVGDEAGISEDYSMPDPSLDEGGVHSGSMTGGTTGYGRSEHALDQTGGMGTEGSSSAYTTTYDPHASRGNLEAYDKSVGKGGLLGLGILTPENFQTFLGRLAAGALGTVVGGPLGAFVGYQYGPEIYEWAKKEGYLDWMPDLDFKGDPESPDFKGTIDEFPTEPVPEDKVEEKEKEEEEEEEEEGRWDKYYREREERGPIDPYKGSEKTLEDIYGPNWREILARGVS